MFGPDGPDPELYRLKAKNRAARRDAIDQRIREHPNTWLAADIVTLLVLIFIVTLLTLGLVGASIAAPPIFSKWVLSPSPWIVWPLLGTVTLGTAWVAWWFRDVRKSKYYPLLEMTGGVALSLQGVVQQGLMLSQTATFVAALIAYVGGLRITIDGWKRFHDHGTKSLFSSQHLLRAMREFQKP